MKAAHAALDGGLQQLAELTLQGLISGMACVAFKTREHEPR